MRRANRDSRKQKQGGLDYRHRRRLHGALSLTFYINPQDTVSVAIRELTNYINIINSYLYYGRKQNSHSRLRARE